MTFDYFAFIRYYYVNNSFAFFRKILGKVKQGKVNRFMKKRIMALLLAVLMVILSFSDSMGEITTVKAAENPVMRVHYHRADGNYTDWSVWLWPTGGEGTDNAFDGTDDFGVYATYEIPAGATEIGYIVRTPGWDKDVDADQFVDISELASGSVDIYIESGIEGCTKELGEDAVIGIKVKNAKYDNETNTVAVTMTGEISGDLNGIFAVAGKAGDVEVTSVTEGENFVYTLELADTLVISKSYTLTYEGNVISINMPNVYSTDEFEAEYTYTGDDLGAVWSKDKTTFRVWAPTAESMVLKLYEGGNSAKNDVIEEIEMTPDVNGTWVAQKEGDLNGVYYTYSVTIDGKTTTTIDPYARTAGYNGERGMIIDLDSTDPEGWDEDTNPHAGETINDAVIYEGHIRDLTVDSDSGITNKGKYLGLTETGTTTSTGIATGIDHLKELGITHLQILPFYDFGSVNELTATGEMGYNWGYDPVNYNVPEGSYSTDPKNGEVRVKEVKEMIKALHDNDISVVMDVVYNHVQSASTFCFNVLVPGYFSRINQDGSYSSGSGCGNDTASERAMVRKYIVDSVNYWVDEYHIDGFRFDLVGLLDVDTVNEIVETVHETHPDVIFYGEGWSLTTSVTKFGTELATQQNSGLTPSFAYFNDNIRDDLKGSVFNTEAGFVSGAEDKESAIINDFLGDSSWCKSPSQTINYVSCHDNNTLYDRLRLSREDADNESIIKMNNLAAAIYLTAEGIPFMQAGEDMLRTKTNSDGTYNSNSYNAGDLVNTIDYNSLEDEQYLSVFNYYKGLIAFRKAHASLRLSSAEDVEKYISNVDGLDANLIAFEIAGGVENETAEGIYIAFNANEEAKEITLPEGNWNVYVDADTAGTTPLYSVSGTVSVDPISALILIKEDASAVSDAETETDATWAFKPVDIIFIAVAVLVIIGLVTLFFKKKKFK